MSETEETVVFRKSASNGTPYDYVDYVQETYPKLWAKIEAGGMKYDDGKHRYNSNGQTVFQNKSSEKKSTNPEKAAANEQRQKDIKAAQEENRKRHKENMLDSAKTRKALRNLTRAIVANIADRSGQEAKEVEDLMGFEDWKADQEADLALENSQ